ncbi:hypothetical protein [Streptomyces wuyuanensis]|uniref:hypothetical protein n=1 Tax=Streptomyces wuyuanensis TaxID=1196353 RepID=UPI0037BB715F
MNVKGSGYLRQLLEMLDEPAACYQDSAAWQALEENLGAGLSGDSKAIADAFAPVVLNGYLYLNHPATERWNLGEWIRSTAEAWSQVA